MKMTWQDLIATMGAGVVCGCLLMIFRPDIHPPVIALCISEALLIRLAFTGSTQ